MSSIPATPTTATISARIRCWKTIRTRDTSTSSAIVEAILPSVIELPSKQPPILRPSPPSPLTLSHCKTTQKSGFPKSNFREPKLKTAVKLGVRRHEAEKKHGVLPLTPFAVVPEREVRLLTIAHGCRRAIDRRRVCGFRSEQEIDFGKGGFVGLWV
ncbi:uncharacterized protein G2W53_037442 [Senna tora]|uniref:Uncharacterized protein n=1 Tax=Senna tora TaxID=362788 RepID=A0A834SVB4_9FABA|nr:uncharacterized protein G2W53_044587 [Senna tora]KAF7810699.1 uncharacterized protein G2W53_037442 [Senna tora]